MLLYSQCDKLLILYYEACYVFELGRPINEYKSHRCSGFFRRQFKRTKGVHAAFPQAECLLIPLADGGEGTLEALAKATGGRVVATRATDPLGNRIESFFGVLGDGETAVQEN